MKPSQVVQLAKNGKSTQLDTENIIVFIFDVEPKSRFQRLITATSTLTADWFKLPKKICGGGHGCMWFAQDISGASSEEIRSFSEFVRKAIQENGQWANLRLAEVRGRLHDNSTYFRVKNNNGSFG